MPTTFILLGDVHNDLNWCHEVHRRYRKKVPGCECIQLGDLGCGFCYHGEPDTDKFRKLPSTFKFFPGNHDNRQECLKLPNCLGNFGEYKGLYFVSGADSIDKDSRTLGIDFWDDEELSYSQLEEAIEGWRNSSAEVLLAHDGPQSIVQAFWPYITEKSRTRQALDIMITARKPKQIIFGHHHKSVAKEVNGIYYRCLDINEPYKLEL